jgi:hypothetical protein
MPSAPSRPFRPAGLATIGALLSLALPGAVLAQSPAPAHSPVPERSGAPVGSTAHVVTQGDVNADLVLPLDPDSELPTGDGSFDLRWQDEQLDTLVLTLDVSGGAVTSAFVAVGVPGTSIDDPDWYADFLRNGCDVNVTRMDASGVAGAISCKGLENAASGKDARSIDLDVQFAASPPAPVVTPSIAPAAADSATLVTIGDIATSLTLARTSETRLVDSGSGTELWFADDGGNTLHITFDLDPSSETPLGNAFVAIGLPGKSIFDADFFPDAFHSQCTVTPTQVDTSAIAGTLVCQDLTNGDSSKTIDAVGAFNATR